jgi:regulator of protease activity HflC (stomatin/prohibitin superfamily)
LSQLPGLSLVARCYPRFAQRREGDASSHAAEDREMRVRSRKLFGTIMLLLLLAVYATLGAVIGSGRIAQAPQWVQFAFFLTAGLAWVIPAGVLIRWMQRPD